MNQISWTIGIFGIVLYQEKKIHGAALVAIHQSLCVHVIPLLIILLLEFTHTHTYTHNYGYANCFLFLDQLKCSWHDKYASFVRFWMLKNFCSQEFWLLISLFRSSMSLDALCCILAGNLSLSLSFSDRLSLCHDTTRFLICCGICSCCSVWLPFRLLLSSQLTFIDINKFELSSCSAPIC